MISTTDSEFPAFFSLTPARYAAMQDEILALRATIGEIKQKRSYAYWRDIFDRKLAAKEAEFTAAVAELTSSPWAALTTAYRAHTARFPGCSPRFKLAVRQAYRRGHVWDLDPARYDAIAAMPCVTCGGPTGGGVGLDRIDHRLGYVEGNVQPMCGPCNINKGRRKAA